MNQKLVVGALLALGGLAIGCAASPEASRDGDSKTSVLDVYPGDDIQDALEKASGYAAKPVIRVHAGTYRPNAPGQALIFLNARHDGITLQAVGDVVLTAANPDRADAKAPSYPAIVNHVVYFGDQLSSKTVFCGFKITGANGFVRGPKGLKPIDSVEALRYSTKFRTLESSPIEENHELPKTHYFFTDGGGILVYGRSYPTIDNVEIYGNYGSVCGAAVSVQHQLERFKAPVLFKNCVFRNNRAAISGCAVDV